MLFRSCSDDLIGRDRFVSTECPFVLLIVLNMQGLVTALVEMFDARIAFEYQLA